MLLTSSQAVQLLARGPHSEKRKSKQLPDVGRGCKAVWEGFLEVKTFEANGEETAVGTKTERESHGRGQCAGGKARGGEAGGSLGWLRTPGPM